MRWVIGATAALYTFTALATGYGLATKRLQPVAAQTSTPYSPPITRPRESLGPGDRAAIRTIAELWVNEGAYLMYERAGDERDINRQVWIRETYEHFFVRGLAGVTVLKRKGDMIHVEIIDGQHGGRRGWMDLQDLTPEPSHG